MASALSRLTLSSQRDNVDVILVFVYYSRYMNNPMIQIKLNEALEKKGRTVYWLARTSGIPHVTLWNLSKVDTQRSINLNVLSHICAALECKPGDLLEFVPDAEDEAIASVVKVKDAATKTAKKKGAREGKTGVSRTGKKLAR